MALTNEDKKVADILEVLMANQLAAKVAITLFQEEQRKLMRVS